ncbi:substrate-binding periplasmic protein [Pseudoalteromonas mariniglutinosa]|uniref:substrate-binding periplasmic protein n=1 Tax=Pseudoalteromonas mariniglutinosa TaxID=206042 RepID=UPI00384ECEBF
MTPILQASNEKITACIDDYPPYQHIGAMPYGIHVTALKKLAHTLNRQLQFVEAPNFARCIKLLELGKADVIAGLNKSEEREKFAFYAPYKNDDGHVFIFSENNIVNHYRDLKGKIIGVPRGTTYFEQFDHDNSLNKIAIQSVEVGIGLLLKKRIDVIITSRFVAASLLTEIKQSSLNTAVLEHEYDKESMSYFGFSKKNKLNLTEQEVILLTTEAFNKGTFEVEAKQTYF